MTSILLDNNTYINTALHYAKQGKATKALKLLAKCDNYEGHINRILLLFLRADYEMANHLVANVCHRFGDRYNVLHDVKFLLEQFADGFCRHLRYQLPRKKTHKDMQNIDLSLIVSVDDEYLRPAEYLSDESLDLDDILDMTRVHHMYDIRSTEYLNHLKTRAYLQYAQGNIKEGNQLFEQVLETDTSDVPMLLWKIEMYNSIEEYGKASKIAESIYTELDQADDLCTVAICISRVSGDKDIIRYIIGKVLADIDECSVDNIEEMMYICNDYLVDYALAGRFAQSIVSSQQYFPINSLRSCINVYLNKGDISKAKDVTTSLLQVVPNDMWAQAMLRILTCIDIKCCLEYASALVPQSLRATVLPKVAINGIVNVLNDQEQLNALTALCIRSLAVHCKMLLRTSQLPLMTIDLAQFYIDNIDLDNNIEYWETLVLTPFMLEQYPLDLGAEILAKYVLHGKVSKVLMGVNGTLYWLDCKALLTLVDNMPLLKAICVVCMCVKMTPRLMSVLLQQYHDEYSQYHHCDIASILLELCQVDISNAKQKEIAEMLEWLHYKDRLDKASD